MADLHPKVDVVTLKAAAACERAGVEYAVIGGIAVNALGLYRETDDADFVLGVEKESSEAIDRLLGELAAEGFRLDPEAVRKRLARGPNLITAWLGLTRIDFLLKRPDAYWRSALEHRRKVRFGERELWVGSLEDVVALKLVAARPQDLADVRGLLAIHRGRVGRERLRALVNRFAAQLGRPELAAELENLLAEADALPLD